jgi:aquaporin Z
MPPRPLLVFGGVGSAVVAGEVIGALGVALAFGLALLAMAYAIGPISGCHINPAVTVGLVFSRRLSWPESVQYFVGQVLGAVCGGVPAVHHRQVARGRLRSLENGFGANGFGDHSPGSYPLVAALIAEIVLTGLLVFTVLSATDRLANVAFAGIPIGLVLTLIHLVSIPIDNTSVNPARSIGPAVFVGGWALGQLWLFIVAPILGAIGGALLHTFLFSGAEPVEPEASAVAAEPPVATA